MNSLLLTTFHVLQTQITNLDKRVSELEELLSTCEVAFPVHSDCGKIIEYHIVHLKNERGENDD